MNKLRKVMTDYYMRLMMDKEVKDSVKYLDMIECAKFDSWSPSFHSGKLDLSVKFARYRPLKRVG